MSLFSIALFSIDYRLVRLSRTHKKCTASTENLTQGYFSGLTYHIYFCACLKWMI